MKRIILISSLVLAIGLMAFSLTHWDNKIEDIAKNAKAKIEATKKADPSLASEAPSTVNNVASTTGETQASASNPNGAMDAANGAAESASTPNGQTTGSEAASVNPSEQPQPAPEAPVTSAAPAIKSVDEIKTEYQQILSELEIQENSKVDQLVVQAKADAVSQKYTKAELAVNYQDAVSKLESNADKTFNNIYKQLEVDLQTHGYDVNEAAAFKQEYQSKKDERRVYVMNQLKVSNKKEDGTM